MSEGSPRKELEEEFSDEDGADDNVPRDSEEEGDADEEDVADEEDAVDEDEGDEDTAGGYKLKRRSETTEFSSEDEDEEDTASSFPPMEKDTLDQSEAAKRKRYLDGSDSDCDPDWFPWEENNKNKKRSRM